MDPHSDKNGKEPVQPRNYAFTITLSLFVILAPALEAMDGDLDPSFGIGGKVTTDFGQSTDLANAVALQRDGKLVVGGMTYVNDNFSNEDFALARYNADGSLDPSFGVGGKVTTDFPGLAAVISAIVIQPDGKIVVAGGTFPLLVFLGDLTLARYNPDGTLDASFGNGGIVKLEYGDQGSYGFALALQQDGKIVVAGTHFVDFSSDDSSNTDFALARLNSDGTLDPTFGNGGLVTTDFDGLNDDAFSVLIQPDNKIIAVGSEKNPANYYDFAAVRYLANGTIDSTFGDGGKVRTDFGHHDFDRARAAALQADGKIVTAGFTISRNGTSQNFAVARYDSNGVLDPSYGTGGLTQVDFGSCCQSAYGVLVQTDGKSVVVGYPNSESSDSDFLLARLDVDGSLDPAFGSGGKVRTSFGNLNGGANAALLQPDGKIVAVGFQATASANTVEFALARYQNAAPLSFIGAVSRKTHGSAGVFDVALPLTGEPGVECRTSRGRDTLVFSFSSDIVSANAAVTQGIGSVSGPPTFSGNTITVNLAGVADVQQITVTLTNVTGSNGVILRSAAVSMNVLAGDATADKNVTPSDVMAVRRQAGMPVTIENFRDDLDASGDIARIDAQIARRNIGHGLP
jgi:uncharacterized delta-60 repeat protein